MSGYIGTQPVPQATQTRDVFTATSGQTTFATSGYTPNFLDVWLNGVKLVNGDDFTATNGSDVVLTTGATAGDTVEVLSYSTFEVNSQTFTGTTTLTGDLQATTATFSGAVTGTSATLSGGVYLGGTGAANLLDDYEAGTWTISVTGATTSSTVTYTSRTGTYTRIGNTVVARGNVVIDTFSGGSGTILISLPITVSSAADARGSGVVGYAGGISNGSASCLLASPGSSYAALYRGDSNATSHIAVPTADFSGGEILRFTIVYQA